MHYSIKKLFYHSIKLFYELSQCAVLVPVVEVIRLPTRHFVCNFTCAWVKKHPSKAGHKLCTFIVIIIKAN